MPYHPVLPPSLSWPCLLLAEPGWKPEGKEALVRKLKGVSFPGRKGREVKRMDGEGQGCLEVASRDYSSLRAVSVFKSIKKHLGTCVQNTAGKAMMSKTWQLLQGIYSFFVGEIEVSIRELNYKAENK